VNYYIIYLNISSFLCQFGEEIVTTNARELYESLRATNYFSVSSLGQNIGLLKQ
jgi:hypothetical protein